MKFGLIAYFVPPTGFIIPGAIAAQAQPTDPGGWMSLGVGGVLAGVMFYFYRRDRETSESRYVGAVERMDSAFEKNCEALTRLTTVIEKGEVFSQMQAMLDDRRRNQSE